jgi:hypothetical protein
MPPGGDWPVVVILDHPLELVFEISAGNDAIVISVRDWLGLHQMIRSTRGVVDYVHRIVEADVQASFGAEMDRYRRLAEADDAWAKLSPTAYPILPLQPLDGRDRANADLFDDLISKVADPEARGWDEEGYLDIVEQLDRMPVVGRAGVGAKMERTFHDMVQNQARRSFVVADTESDRRLTFLYEYDDGSFGDGETDGFRARIGTYGLLRHTHFLEAGAPVDSATVAVGVLHNDRLGRRYAFAFFRGLQVLMPADLRRQLEQEFGVFDGTRVRPAITS